MAKHGVSESATDATPAKPGETGKPGEKPAAKEEPGKPIPDKARDKTDADVPVEFAKHPAWKRIMGERDAARAESAGLKPKADILDGNIRWMEERGIAPAEHPALMEAYAQVRAAGVEPEYIRQVLQWRTLVETDPQKAYEIAAPIVEMLATKIGKALPPDLQSKVDAGEITLELAKDYAQQRLKASGHDQFVQRTTQQQQRQAQRLVESAVGDWITQKQTANPSFVKGKDGEDGLWEAVERRIHAAATAKVAEIKRALNSQEMVQICEAAYTAEQKYQNRFKPQAPERKPPFNGSSRNSADSKPDWSDNDSIIDAALAAQSERG